MIEFAKMHVAGNDFIVVEGDSGDHDWSAVARALCARRYAVGSDGLMVVEGRSAGNPFVRMFNPDGTEDVCGNGMLCLAAFLRERGAVENDEFTINSMDGPKDVRLEIDRSGALGVKINLGPARFDPELIPAVCDRQPILAHTLDIESEGFEISALTTGTPHVIVFCDALPDDDYFFKWAPRIGRHAMFPENTCVTWAVVDSPKKVRTRIWERGGVGESLSCGTGACAVVAVSSRLNLTESRVAVHSPGGELAIESTENGDLWLGAIPRKVYTGRADDSPRKG